MSFQWPSENDPFYKRIFVKTLLFIPVIAEIMLPVLIALFVIGMIVTITVMFCGVMLGLIPDPTKNTDDNSSSNNNNNKGGQTDSSNPAQAVDEKTRINVEMELLREMLQARQEKFDKLNLVKND
ncbi:uncharacterized protein ASPGLDRAFT_42985 [Aspergillus glaucus CBS 516.65]|uniref:Uncharacterized protein n=1 Tax=Aspergillus glaucus CBS 516.65 TaxID=1160497 RepID=A0A1L9VVH8_ASPGL|nr:hypothetical protein ASPGLDRAFT_42985 [Aspergillus glaucus CBS 516.65]OJJ87918.1 hypothetical protein ASPGLDRAFT_42985 [Aspergillus glaucus CBS 516.65]